MSDPESTFRYWRQIGSFYLSVIERSYCIVHAGGNVKGKESAILSGPVTNRKLEWLSDGNFVAEFNAMETEEDVKSFIKGEEDRDEP